MRSIITASLLFSASLTVPAQAQTYYVDATNGNDNWSGTLPDAQGTDDGPWQAISRVNAATSFQPGDVIKLKRGQRWDETLVVPASGTLELPIIFTDYPDPANPQAPKPLFDGLTDVSTGAYQWIEATEWNRDNGNGGTRRIWYLKNTIDLNLNFVNWGMVIQDSAGLRRVRQQPRICDLDANAVPTTLPVLDELQDGEYSYSSRCPNHTYWTFYLRWDAGKPGDPSGPPVFLIRSLQATSLPPGHATSIDTNGKNHIVIENLAVRGAAAAHGTSAILINNSVDVKVRNNEIYFSKVAIGTFAAGVQRSANNCSIMDNEVFNNIEDGIYIAGDSSNNTISRNHVHHNFNLADKTGDLISIGITGSDGAANRSTNVIEYNDVHDNGTYGVGIDHVIAIYQAADTAVRYNDIHDNQQGAFYFAFNSINSKFYYNRIYGNRVKNGFHLKLQGTDNLAMYNNTVYGNHVEADCDADDDGDCEDRYCYATRTAYSDLASCEAVPACIGKCEMYGIAPYGYGSYRLFTVDGPASNARIENNIIARNTMVSNTGYPAYLAWIINATGLMNHNLYFENISTDDQGAGQPLWRFGSNPARATLGEWQGDGHDGNSEEGNPYFIDATSANFHLQPGSPAIDRGRDVGLTQDIDGVPLASQPDIGVHELPQVNLSISITDTPDPVLINNTVTYTVTVTNNGPSSATGVTVAGTLSSCNLGAVASGASASCARTTTATGAGTLSQTMTVSAIEYDPSTANNSVTATTTVNAPDLTPTAMSATKASQGRVLVSEAVQNQGDGAAGSFTAAYYLSTNTTYEPGTDIPLASSSSGSGNCTRSVISLGVGTPDAVTDKVCYKPADAVKGTQYYMLVVDDSGDQVTESNEANNVRATTARIKW